MAEIEIVNLAQKLQLFDDYWTPKIVGELNGQQLKLAKFKGDLSRTRTRMKTSCFWCFQAS